jgi:hypothetical protein
MIPFLTAAAYAIWGALTVVLFLMLVSQYFNALAAKQMAQLAGDKLQQAQSTNQYLAQLFDEMSKRPAMAVMTEDQVTRLAAELKSRIPSMLVN